MKDARLKNKGWYGMNMRTCWFVVETKEDFDDISFKYPGCILLIDRSYIQDTKGEKPLDGTMLLHEVSSAATEVPSTLLRIWSAKVANLPCNCQYCTIDPIITMCSYS